MSNSQEVNWPERKEHWRGCDIYILANSDCNCGARYFNACHDAFMKVIKAQPKMEVCDTTNTTRLSTNACKGCGTYVGNLGPCETFSQGMNERCAYCDHQLECHPIAWHLIERYATLVEQPEMPSVKQLEEECLKQINPEDLAGNQWLKNWLFPRIAQAIHQRLKEGRKK